MPKASPNSTRFPRVPRKMGCRAPVALRLNPDIDAKTHAKTTTGKRGNKFGMDIEKAAHAERSGLARCASAVERDPHAFGFADPVNRSVCGRRQRAAQVVAEFRRRGHDTNWINLGGGFGISYRKEEGPPAADYANVIVSAVQKAGCRLALEPGRFIVGNAGVLVSKVIYTKQEGGKKFVIQDAAMNDLMRPAMYDAFHRIWPAQPHIRWRRRTDFEGVLPDCEPVDIVGPICESSDYLAKDRYFPTVDREEITRNLQCRSLRNGHEQQLQQPTSGAEIMVDGTTVSLIRRRETMPIS